MRSQRDCGFLIADCGWSVAPFFAYAARCAERLCLSECISPILAAVPPIMGGGIDALVDLMRENGMEDTLILVGGIVPNEDIPEPKANGVSEVFLPGTSTEDIVKFITANVRSQN